LLDLVCANCCTWNSLRYEYGPQEELLERSPTEKVLGVLVDEKLDMSHQCACSPVVILGCIRRGVASREREGTVLLCSASVGTHLEHCSQAWEPQHKKDKGDVGAGPEEGHKSHQRAVTPVL